MACGVSQSTKSRFRAGGGLGHRTQGPRGSCRLAEGPSRVEGGLLRRARSEGSFHSDCKGRRPWHSEPARHHLPELGGLAEARGDGPSSLGVQESHQLVLTVQQSLSRRPLGHGV